MYPCHASSLHYTCLQSVVPINIIVCYMAKIIFIFCVNFSFLNNMSVLECAVVCDWVLKIHESNSCVIRGCSLEYEIQCSG